MRSGAALVVVCGLVGCAPREEGVVITIHEPDSPGFEAVHKLELFLGGARQIDAGDRRIRNVVDSLGGEDLRPVDGPLEGYTIFLDGIPPDVDIVAIAGYADTPEEPEALPIALATTKIEFTPGQLTSIDLTMRAANNNMGRTATRWIGPPLPGDPEIGHSCLEWSQIIEGQFVREAIVRPDDFDCDGTLPTGCSDPGQQFPAVPDDSSLEEDRDGDGAFTCRTCTSPVTGDDVPCECNDDPATGDTQSAFHPEECDGIDNDCEPSTFYEDHPEDFGLCFNDLGGAGDCEIGVLGCDEEFGDTEPNSCKPTITHPQIPCGFATTACTSPDTCVFAGVDPTALIQCESGYGVDPCMGSVSLVELIDDLDPTPGSPPAPAICSATIWGTDQPLGWAVRLVDQTGAGPSRLVRDQPCDQVQVEVESQSSDGEHFGAIVLVFDSQTGQRYGIPLSFRTNGGSCGIPPLQCIAPP